MTYPRSVPSPRIRGALLSAFAVLSAIRPASCDAPAYEETAKPPASRAAIAVEAPDPEAQGGKALRMAPEKQQSNIVSDFYVYPKYPGRYRFIWRLKVDSNIGDARVVDLNPGFPEWGMNKNPTLSLKPSDWKRPATYQDFVVEGVVPEHDYGVLSTYFDAAAGRAVWWDTGTYKLVEAYDDPRIAKEFYPSFTLPSKVARTPATDKPRTYVLFHTASYESSRIRDALAQLGLKPPAVQDLPADIRSYRPPPPIPADSAQWRETAWIDHPQSRKPAPGFPDTPEALQDLDLIVLSDVSARAIEAPGRLLVREWVRQAGGGLLLTGGMAAFGRGYLNGTVFEEMLPVRLGGVNDLKPAKDGRLIAKDAALATLLGTTALSTRFYHALPAKPEAHVLIEAADGSPLLVEWPYGKGRVAVWLGAALGSGFPTDRTAWWKSDAWPSVLAETCRRIAGK